MTKRWYEDPFEIGSEGSGDYPGYAGMGDADDDSDAGADYGEDYGAWNWGETANLLLNPFAVPTLIAKALTKKGVPPKHAQAIARSVARRVAPAGGLPMHPAALAMLASPPARGGKPGIADVLSRYFPGGGESGRVQILPVDSGTAVGAGATASVTANPQRKFRADVFIIGAGTAGGTADDFLINSITIGADPQFVSSAGSIPGGMFQAASVNGNNLRGTTAVPGVQIAVSVTNLNAAGRRFTGAFKGPALD